MGKTDNHQDPPAACAFKPLCSPAEEPAAEAPEADNACAFFQPLYRQDGSASGDHQHLKGKELAAFLEEVQQVAMGRGQEGGRAEAGRMAQASLLPHLKQMIEQLNAMVLQARIAEDKGSEDSIALAMSIVEQVTGDAPGTCDADYLKSALRRSIALANRYLVQMNGDDLNYLMQLMKEHRLSWPDHPSIAIEAGPGLEQGQFRLTQHGDPAETLDHHIVDHITDFFSKNNHPMA